jgi:hypothetical protein
MALVALRSRVVTVGITRRRTWRTQRTGAIGIDLRAMTIHRVVAVSEGFTVCGESMDDRDPFTRAASEPGAQRYVDTGIGDEGVAAIPHYGIKLSPNDHAEFYDQVQGMSQARPFNPNRPAAGSALGRIFLWRQSFAHRAQ